MRSQTPTERLTERQERNVALFHSLPDRDATVAFVTSYVARFLPLSQMGHGWGVTFCPSGDPTIRCRVNGGAQFFLSLRRHPGEGPVVWITLPGTASARGIATRLRSSGYGADVEQGRGLVPFISLGAHGWEAAEQTIEWGADLMEPYVDQVIRRPLLNTGWHNPLAGDLLVDALDGRPRRVLQPRALSGASSRSSTGPAVRRPATQPPGGTRMCPTCGLRRSTAQFVAGSELCIDCR